MFYYFYILWKFNAAVEQQIGVNNNLIMMFFIINHVKQLVTKNIERCHNSQRDQQQSQALS